MAYKLQTEVGRAIYRLRKCTVEPVFGCLKEVLGFRQFSLRGLIRRLSAELPQKSSEVAVPSEPASGDTAWTSSTVNGA